jgi:glycosyltransferase involved in cell wall biosynthesis
MVEFKSKMNILFFTRLFYPHIGGVEKHVMEISKSLIKKGHVVAVVTEQYTQNLKLKENIGGIEVFRIPNVKDGKLKKFVIWKWLWNNRQLIKNSDVIHCHDVFFWYLPFRFLFPFKKIFTTFHGYENYPLKSKYIIMHKLSEILSMGNICIGDFIKKWYGTKPTLISYGGVDEVRNDGSKIINDNSALFIGRLDAQTGILAYARGVEIIRKKIKNFEFLVIGDGKLKDKIGKNIRILKPLSNARKYFGNYNFAFVSRYLSMMEAMAAKRLIFAVYDNPLKEDYLRMTPFSQYIEIFNSPSELASKVYFYLNNPKNKEKKINDAYAWVKKHTWKQVVNSYLILWDKKF